MPLKNYPGHHEPRSMLSLLLHTRLRYYRNYLRHHFDRVVWLEIGVIVLILFYLAGRSPADIGYSLKFLLEKDFPLKYAAQWVALLPVFYLIVEALAFITLRPTGEWQILGTLPVAKPAIVNYHLLRHSGKTAGLLFIGTMPFLIGGDGIIEKLARVIFAFGILAALQFAGFLQAYNLHNTGKSLLQRIRRWLPFETVMLMILFIGGQQLEHLLLNANGKILLAWPAGGILAMALFFYLHRNYAPGLIESSAPITHKALRASKTINFFSRKGGTTSALIRRDLKFLWMEKRSAYILLVFAAIVILLAGLAQSTAEEAYASSIVIEIIFSFMLINALLILFEHDAKAAALTRSLPISAATSWKARWLLAAGFMLAPVLFFMSVLPFIYTSGIGFVLFLVIGFIIPAIFSALFCNAGYGLFPNIKYCSVLLNISLGLMLLFWFYMPFGTTILLVISVLWIRRSQRHFQFLEIT